MSYYSEAEKKNIGSNLEKYREKANLTIADMSVKIGTSLNHISAIEKGVTKCDAAILKYYAETCKVSADVLLGII